MLDWRRPCGVGSYSGGRPVTTTSANTHSEAPAIPTGETTVDYGTRQPGSGNPMPATEREAYEKRIRNAVDAQAAGATRAAQLFIR